MSNVQLDASRTPHDLGRFVFTCGDIGRLKVIDATPVMPGDSYECDMVGALRLSPLRRGLAIDAKTDICTFYVPHRHSYGDDWIQFLRDGVNGNTLPVTDLARPEQWAAGFLGVVPNASNQVPKWLFESYCRIYDNYFTMPELVKADGTRLPRDLNQWSDNEVRHGMECCHLKNVWTATLPTDTATSHVMAVTGGLDLMGLNNAYGALHTEQERELFMRRYRDVVDSFGGSTHYDADQRPHMLMRSEFWASGYDVDGTDTNSLGQFSGRVQQSFNHRVPRFYVPEHGCIMTVLVTRFPPIHQRATPYYIGQPHHTYMDFAGDAAIDGNMVPREVPISALFRSEDVNTTLKIPHGQWFRSVPDYVDFQYTDLQGFPFLEGIPRDNHVASTVLPEDYDQCFQTTQLRQWNCQLKTNVNVLRALPTARQSLMVNA